METERHVAKDTIHLDRNDQDIRHHNHDWRELNAEYTKIREKDKKEGQGMCRMRERSLETQHQTPETGHKMLWCQDQARNAGNNQVVEWSTDHRMGRHYAGLPL